MRRNYPYFWVIPVLVGLVFIFSNVFWLVPFINNVRIDVERYQLAVAERIASQADFFLEKKLRELGDLVVSFIKISSNKNKTSSIINDFLKNNPDFVSVKLMPKSFQDGSYFVSPIFINDGKKVFALRLSLSFMEKDIEAVVDLSNFINSVSQEKIGEKGYAYVLDGSRNIIFHPLGALQTNPEDFVTITTKSNSTGWIVAVEDPIEEALIKEFYALILAVVLMLVGLVFVIILLINFNSILNIALREKALSDAKSEYISLLAHRLRTPLASVKWNLFTLINGDWGTVNEKQKKFLVRSYDSNEQMIQLIRDLLSIARIEQGRFGFKKIKTDMTKLLQGMVNEFKLSANQADIRLSFKKSPSRIPRLMLDAEKMKVVVGNLIDNAIRYNLPGGKVEVMLKKEDNRIRIDIKDTGVGITKKDLDSLFSKFFRGDNVVKMQKEGFGLGLYIVKNIVEGHNGKITVQSEENKGSMFSILLPEK